MWGCECLFVSFVASIACSDVFTGTCRSAASLGRNSLLAVIAAASLVQLPFPGVLLLVVVVCSPLLPEMTSSTFCVC